MFKKSRGKLEVEVDELWSFSEKKEYKQWIWLALGKRMREIIAYHVGRRGREDAGKFWHSFPPVYRQCATLEQLNNPHLSASFAIRISLISLLFLIERADIQGFLWYWKSEEREKHFLATLRASQVASLVLFNPVATVAASDAGALS